MSKSTDALRKRMSFLDGKFRAAFARGGVQ